jgi:hypothetical protein
MIIVVIIVVIIVLLLQLGFVDDDFVVSVSPVPWTVSVLQLVRHPRSSVLVRPSLSLFLYIWRRETKRTARLGVRGDPIGNWNQTDLSYSTAQNGTAKQITTRVVPVRSGPVVPACRT